MTDWVKTILTFDPIREIKNQILNNAPYTAHASLGFVVQILMIRQELGEDHIILNEIANLESERTASVTKLAEQFKKPPLHPFWHKHFSAPRHMMRNIAVRWALDCNGNDDLSQLIDETARKFGDQPDLWPKYLTHRLVVGGYQEGINVKRMTGDWVVFAKHDGQNSIWISQRTKKVATPIASWKSCAREVRRSFPSCLPDLKRHVGSWRTPTRAQAPWLPRPAIEPSLT